MGTVSQSGVNVQPFRTQTIQRARGNSYFSKKEIKLQYCYISFNRTKAHCTRRSHTLSVLVCLCVCVCVCECAYVCVCVCVCGDMTWSKSMSVYCHCMCMCV